MKNSEIQLEEQVPYLTHVKYNKKRLNLFLILLRRSCKIYLHEKKDFLYMPSSRRSIVVQVEIYFNSTPKYTTSIIGSQALSNVCNYLFKVYSFA